MNLADKRKIFRLSQNRDRRLFAPLVSILGLSFQQLNNHVCGEFIGDRLTLQNLH